MCNDPSAGLGFLGDIDGLFIQQKLELFEAITARMGGEWSFALHMFTRSFVHPLINSFACPRTARAVTAEASTRGVRAGSISTRAKHVIQT